MLNKGIYIKKRDQYISSKLNIQLCYKYTQIYYIY